MTTYARTQECEAIQWNGKEITETYPSLSSSTIVSWINTNGGEARYEPNTHPESDKWTANWIVVRTAIGWDCVAPGHYIVMSQKWVHCSPQLILSGYNCASGERRHCECGPDYGSHDHLLREFTTCDPETFKKQGWVAR